MRSLDRRVVAGGIAIIGLGVVIAAEAFSRDADRAVLGVAAAAEAGIVPAELMIASRTSEQTDQAAMWAVEPDPARYDRAGLESWWNNYQKKHPTR